MALSFVGSGFNSNVSGADLTLTLPVGIAEDDVVYVAAVTSGSVDATMAMTTSGYTKLCDLFANDTNDTNLGVFRKVMGASPDATAVVTGTGSGFITIGAVFHVWRGADTATPEDVATTTATGLNSATPNPPAITTVTNDAVVLAIGGSVGELDAVSNAPSGYSNLIDTLVGTSNVMMASKVTAAAGAQDPASYSDISGDSTDSWAAATVAIRPLVVSALTRKWSIPTSVSDGNARRIRIFNGANNTIDDSTASQVAASGVYKFDCADQGTAVGTLKFAILDNWDGNTASVSIFGFFAIAEVIEE